MQIEPTYWGYAIGMFVNDPGMSIVAIDPGGTTGVAVWDAWGQRLYVDQVDAGRGRRAVEHVFGGHVESPKRQMAKKKVGKTNEREILSIVERGVVSVLCDLILAAGPLSIVICEDFVLYAGRPGESNGKREGLSPVRIGTRLEERAQSTGLLNGDAWRRWGVFQSTGKDLRGVRVVDVSGVTMPYGQRLNRAVKWRLAGYSGEDSTAVWAGGGVKLSFKMPGTRLFIGGDEKKTVAWLRDADMWMPGAPHGMDALEHLLALSRKMGCEIQRKPERIW